MNTNQLRNAFTLGDQEPCSDELSLFGDSPGFGVAQLRFIRNTQFPTPSNTGWSSNIVGGAPQAVRQNGVGGFDFTYQQTEQSGQSGSHIFTTTISRNEIDQCQYTNTANSCQSNSTVFFDSPTQNPTIDASRPSVVYDWYHKRYFAFWRRDHSNGLTSPNAQGAVILTHDPRIHFATSEDGSNWTDRGDVEFANPVIQFPLTRFPVGAAYDNYSKRIVLVYTNFTEDGSQTQCSNQVWCQSQLDVMTLPGDLSTTVWSAPQLLSGQTSSGPPAVACEDSNVGDQCAVFNSGTDANRHIWLFRFGLDAGGNVNGLLGAVDTGGFTDFSIGLTDSGPGAQGSFVAVHRGTNSQLFQATAHGLFGGFTGWQQLNVSVPDQQPRFGPQVRLGNTSHDYEIVF